MRQFITIFLIVVLFSCVSEEDKLLQKSFDCGNKCMLNEPVFASGKYRWYDKVPDSFILVSNGDDYDIYANPPEKGSILVGHKSKKIIGFMDTLTGSNVCFKLVRNAISVYGEDYEKVDSPPPTCYRWGGRMVFLYVCCDDAYNAYYMFSTKEFTKIFFNKKRN